jgi:predicted RNA polymerase sigma factor
MVKGPQAGLDQLKILERDPNLAQYHRTHAVRGHLLELLGDREAARRNYERARDNTFSIPEQGYLAARAARLSDDVRD